MPFSKEQIQAFRSDSTVDLSKAKLSDKDISIIIKVLLENKDLTKLILLGNEFYKDYPLFINAILQHSSLLVVVEFANSVVVTDSKPFSQKTPAAIYERVLWVCLSYKNEIYAQVANAKKNLEKLRIELSKDMPPSSKVATLALALRNIHKEIEKIQQREYFIKFFSEKFNTGTGNISYKFSLPELNNLFSAIKNFSDDNVKDRNSLKNIFLDKLKSYCSEMSELNLSGWDLTHQDFTGLVKIFFSSVDSLKKLRRFTLAHFIFSQDAAKFLSLIIKKCSLESVDISNNSNFDAYQEKFFSIIAHSKSITTLNVRNTLSLDSTKALLGVLIKFESSIKVVELTKDRKDSEQQRLLKQLKKNKKNNISSKQDFSESTNYFSEILKSLKIPHKSETLIDLETKFIRFQTQPNLADEKKLYIGIMEFLIALDKPNPDSLASHLAAFGQHCLHRVNSELTLDEKLNYLKYARMYIEKILLQFTVTEDFRDEIEPLALEVHKKYLLLYIKKHVEEFTLSKKDIALIKDYIENSQAISALQENLSQLTMMAEMHSELKQNVIFKEIELVHSEICFFEKKNVSSAENKTNVAYILKESIWGKFGKLGNAVQGFLSPVTEKDEIPDDKSPAP